MKIKNTGAVTMVIILVIIIMLLMLPVYFFRKHPASNTDLIGNLPLLTVSGSNLVEKSSQRLVHLRGFQGLGAYPIPDNIYMRAVYDQGVDPYQIDNVAIELNPYAFNQFDINEIKSTGANVVRIWFVLHEIQKEPYIYSEKSLQLLENMINQLGENGIYSILVLGKINQNSYPSSDAYRSRGFVFWDENGPVWNQSISLWGAVADRFATNTNVAGYDILNEPEAPSRELLHAYYSQAIKAIRRADSNHILFIESENSPEHKVEYQLGGTYNDDNYVPNFHFYFPNDFTLSSGTSEMIPGLTYPDGVFCAYQHSGCTPQAWNKSVLEKIIDTALNLDDFRGRPLYIGEFGANSIRDDFGALTWIKDVSSMMNERNIHYTYPNYRLRGDSHGYYWIATSDNVQKLDELIRGIIDGSKNVGNLTIEDKKLLETENNFYLRPGIKSILTEAFTS